MSSFQKFETTYLTIP